MTKIDIEKQKIKPKIISLKTRKHFSVNVFVFNDKIL